MILPPVENPFVHKMTAAAQVINGFGKTLGLVQLDELGTLETPIALTGTLNVGKVHDALVEYMVQLCQKDGIELTSINPVVGECNDSFLNRLIDRPWKRKMSLRQLKARRLILSWVQSAQEGEPSAIRLKAALAVLRGWSHWMDKNTPSVYWCRPIMDV